MKKKYKLKKDIFLYLALIIAIIIGINKGIKEYKEYKYHKTTEYKLIEKGYSKKDIKLLRKYYTENDLKKLLKEEKNTTLLNLLQNKFYKHKYLDQYLNYYDINQDKTIDEIIRDVNLHHNYEFYEYNIPTNIEDNYQMLVNKYYNLDKNYIPDDLVTISLDYSWGQAGSQKIRKDAYEAYKNMHSAAKEATNSYLMIQSSYRSYDSQESVYNSYLKKYDEAYANKYAAKAGYSEHQTGLALDILSMDNPGQSTFKDTEVYNWLKDNSYKYGFILRYPEGKRDITGYEFEPWHYRYVGIDLAKKIYDSNLTFDEYYEYYLNK